MNRRPGNRVQSFLELAREQPTEGEVNPYRQEHLEEPGVIPASKGILYKGRWSEAFGREAPLHVELGAGSGEHLVAMAERHPKRNWLGIELRFKRVVRIAHKMESLPNVKILRYSWFFLHELFEPGEIQGLQMHHPDPWPKRDQAHNRVMNGAFLELMGVLMAPCADWHTKTDFEPHLIALEAALPTSSFTLLDRRHDIQNQGAPWPDDILTGYQRKSYDENRPVHAIWLRRHPATALPPSR